MIFCTGGGGGVAADADAGRNRVVADVADGHADQAVAEEAARPQRPWLQEVALQHGAVVGREAGGQVDAGGHQFRRAFV